MFELHLLFHSLHKTYLLTNIDQGGRFKNNLYFLCIKLIVCTFF